MPMNMSETDYLKGLVLQLATQRDNATNTLVDATTKLVLVEAYVLTLEKKMEELIADRATTLIPASTPISDPTPIPASTPV